MTTDWKKLTRKDLTTFDKFATDAVLTAMEQGGIGRIGTNGHAKIRGKDGVSITISRDTSAPHCRGNVAAALERAFPALKALKTNAATQKDATVTTKATTTGITQETYDASQEMVECPAKGCDEKFRNLGEANTHVHAEHVICKWEGCDYGPDGGPFVGRTNQAIAGHTNVRHKENKPWLQNREQAAVNRAATVAARKKAAAEQAAAKEADLLNGYTDAIVANMNGHAPDTEGAQRVAPTPPVDSEAEAKLALIREILGDDFEVAKLKKELADVKAHLALVREAVGLDFGPDDS